MAFVSDNGGPPYVANSNWPLRGGKWTLWEGGTHLVGFMHSPVLFSPSPTQYTSLVHHVDLLPTLMAAAGQTHLNDTILPPMDGINLLPSILQHSHHGGHGDDGGDGHDRDMDSLPTIPLTRNSVLLNVDPTNQGSILHDAGGWSGYAGIRVGDWKLVLGDPGTPNDWCWPNQNITKYHSTTGCVGTEYTACQCAYNGTVPNDRTLPHLWNLLNDPEERHDLGNSMDPSHVTKREELMTHLQVYINSAVTPLNETPEERTVDPASSPANNKPHVWMPWQELQVL